MFFRVFYIVFCLGRVRVRFEVLYRAEFRMLRIKILRKISARGVALCWFLSLFRFFVRLEVYFVGGFSDDR